MENKVFNLLWNEALIDNDCETYVSNWALSSIWGDSSDEGVPVNRIDTLEGIWNAAHLSFRDIRNHTGLTRAEFCRSYCIPIRTVEDWESGTRSCPDYLRLLLMQDVGMYKKPVTNEK